MSGLLQAHFRQRREVRKQADDLDLAALAAAMSRPEDAIAQEAARETLRRDPEWSEVLLALGAPVSVRRSTPWTWLGLAGGLAAASLVLALLLVPRSEPELIPKGTLDRLEVAVDRAGVQFPLGPERGLMSGDRLGFFYSAERAGHLAIFHYTTQDGPNVLVPIGTQDSLAVEAGTRHLLHQGGVVEPIHTREWLIAVFANEPFTIAESAEALRRGVAIGADGRLTVSLDLARTIQVVELRGAQP